MNTVQETWQHREIMTNGIRMHYVTQGTGPLIVLLHGFPEFWYSWRYQIPFLANHSYTVVAPDLRGYNDTDKPRTDYRVSTLTRDIVGLVRGLGHEKAVIAGHDWGGILAWSFALSYPEMTERLIVLNAPHPLAVARELRTLKQLRKSWYTFFFQLPQLPEFLLGLNHAEMIGRLLYASAVQKSAFDDDVQARYREAMSKPGALTGGLNYYRAAFRPLRGFPALGGRNAVVEAPTLLIWGEQDVALGIDLTKNIEQWVPHLQLRYIPDSGHWVQQEKPELVNQWMLEFLQGHNRIQAILES